MIKNIPTTFGAVRGGPSIAAVPFQHSGTGLATPLLSQGQRGRLSLIASVVHFDRGATIVAQDEEARSLYNLASGVAKAFVKLPNGDQCGQAFLFMEDLLGLAENGRYVNTVTALTPVTAYCLPLLALERLLRSDPDLQLHFLCKVCQELREAQRHAIALGRNDARVRIGLFLHFLENHPASRDPGDDYIHLPMSRSDIADYVGLTLEAVSRAFSRLQQLGFLRFRDRRTLQIVDRAKFERFLASA